MVREPSVPSSPREEAATHPSAANHYWSIFSPGPADQFSSPQRRTDSASTVASTTISSITESNHDLPNHVVANETTSLLLASPPRISRAHNPRTPGGGTSPGVQPKAWSVKKSPSHRAFLSSSNRQPLLLQSMRHWDVALPPVKKHMVDGSLVETFRGSLYGNDRSRNLPVAKRKLTIELYGNDQDVFSWGSKHPRRRNFSDLERNHRERGYYRCRSGASSCGNSDGEEDSWELFKGVSSDDFSKDDSSSQRSDEPGGKTGRMYELAARDVVVLRIMKSRMVTPYDDEFGLGDNSISGGLQERKWESQSMSERTMSWMVGHPEHVQGDLDDDHAPFSSAESLRKKDVRWIELSRTRLSQIEVVREDFEANEVDLQMGVGARMVVQTFRFDDPNEYSTRTPNRNSGNACTFARLFRLLKWLQKERARRLAAEHRSLLSEHDFHSRTGGTSDNVSQSCVSDRISAKDEESVSYLEENETKTDEMVKILVEIVSARNLPPPEERVSFSHGDHHTRGIPGKDSAGQASQASQPLCDSYVVIRDGKTDIHTTSFVSNSINPVWTLSSGSLCLLQSSLLDFFERSNVLEFRVKSHNTVSGLEDETIGMAMVHKSELLNGTGERKQFQILQPPKSTTLPNTMYQAAQNSKEAPYLYLRYRKASIEDIEFMNRYKEEIKRKPNALLKDGIYASEAFLPPKSHVAVSEQPTEQSERVTAQSTQHREESMTDPKNIAEIGSKTDSEIEEISKEHSASWIMAGSGSIGKLYIEIIRCDNLKNSVLFPTSAEKLDPFVNIVFEDSIVNTDVIHDCRSPRWMPWSQRAFVMNMMHLSSQIFIGVFHYNQIKDLGFPSDTEANHIPLGRGVINLSSLRPRAIHTLTYNLYSSDSVYGKIQGTITVRLRLAIDDERRALLSELTFREHCYISTTNESDFRCASFSLPENNQSRCLNFSDLKLDLIEIIGYVELMDRITAALSIVLLWRGHFPVVLNLDYILLCGLFNRIVTRRHRELVLNLPIHSMVAFSWATALAWDFGKCVSFFCFFIGWVLLATLEDQRRHPSTWRRPRSYIELIRILFFHKSNFWVLGPPPLRRTIYPNERLGEIDRFQSQKAENDTTIQKVEGVISEWNKPLRLLRDPSHPPNIDNVRLDDILFPTQKILRKIRRLLRISSSIFSWRDSHLAFWITSLSFLASIIAFWIPWSWLIQWGFRLIVWPLFGPWMKLVDVYFFQRKKNQIAGEQTSYSEAKILKELYNRIWGEERSEIRRENDLKDTDMKRYMFGKHAIKVPIFQNELFPCEPDFSSSSIPYNTNPRPVHITKHVHGQRLEGNMIPQWSYNSTRANGFAVT